MSTQPIESFQLPRPDRTRRIAILCLPSWGAAIWALLIVIGGKIAPSISKPLATNRSVIVAVTFTAMIAPICWIAAMVSAFRARPTTRLQQVILAASAVAMAFTWIAVNHYRTH